MNSTLIQLDSGFSIPQLGFGTYKLTGDVGIKAVKDALSIGYRHIDTADYYHNHSEVGTAIVQSDVERADIFLTSKVWRDKLHSDDFIECIHRFLEELQTDYLDLALIHWPNKEIPIKETLGAMKQLQQEGVVRSIGVSNFTIRHLQEVLDTGVAIDMNQVEYHPTLQQDELLIFCHQHNIQLTAYSPIGRTEDFEHKVVKTMAEKYNCTAAQIILSWEMAKGIIPIPKATSYEHIKNNFDSSVIKIGQDDIEKINNLEPRNNRMIIAPFAEFDGE